MSIKHPSKHFKTTALGPLWTHLAVVSRSSLEVPRVSLRQENDRESARCTVLLFDYWQWGAVSLHTKGRDGPSWPSNFMQFLSYSMHRCMSKASLLHTFRDLQNLTKSPLIRRVSTKRKAMKKSKEKLHLFQGALWAPANHLTSQTAYAPNTASLRRKLAHSLWVKY